MRRGGRAHLGLGVLQEALERADDVVAGVDVRQLVRDHDVGVVRHVALIVEAGVEELGDGYDDEGAVHAVPQSRHRYRLPDCDVCLGEGLNHDDVVQPHAVGDGKRRHDS